MFLDGGVQLRKDTYVKTEFRYQVHWELLCHYDETGRDFNLHSVSYRDLMNHLHTPYMPLSPPSPSIPAQIFYSNKADSDRDKVNVFANTWLSQSS